MDSTIDSDIDIRYELAALTNMILSSDTVVSTRPSQTIRFTQTSSVPPLLIFVPLLE